MPENPGRIIKMIPQFSAYIFDLDGTLTDSSLAIGKGVIRAMNSVGVDGITVDDVKRWIGRPLIEVYQGYFDEKRVDITLDDATFEKMVVEYRIGHDAHFPSGVQFYPNAVETLDSIRSKGILTAIATTKFQEAADFVVSGVGLAEHVDFVCGTDVDKPVKPDPYVIHLALEKLKSDPAETLVIGDTGADIEAGRAAGCKTAAVNWGFGDQNIIKSMNPDYYLNDLNELA